MHRRTLLFLALFCLLSCVFAETIRPDYTTYPNGTSTNESFPFDPILQYRPPFPRSLPVQILLIGIVLTLASVLLIQLLFTAQYHWPLAPVNFILQVAAVTTLLVTSVVTLYIVLTAVTQQSRTWPYMLNYVAVDIPPSPSTSWPTTDMAAWLLLTATTAGLIQITHIQFLTLLFPSKLERRLIFTLLGPLAVTSAVMQMLRVRHSSTKLLDMISAVQNVCNATLSLLFTASLFLWGLLVNRKNAWRMDGGTAAFGIGALTLAPMSSAIAILYIPTKEQYLWMPQLMWAIILWQSFLGWWWWVGAGMGVGEVDELLKREEKRKNKRDIRSAKRRMQRERAETLWREVTGAFGFGSGQRSGVERSPSASSSPTSSPERVQRRPSLNSLSTSGSSLMWKVFNYPPGRQVHGWFLHWRHAHLTAAREQAVERVERMNHMYGKGGANATRMRGSFMGWGLGNLGARPEQDVRDDVTIVASDSDIEEGEDVKGSEEMGKQGDIVLEIEHGAHSVRRRGRRRRTGGDVRNSRPQPQAPIPEEERTSLWWWGPLRRWRLHDTTVY